MSKLMYDHFESCLDEGHYDSMVFEAAYAGNNMELFKWTVDLYKTYEGYENESVLGPAASGGQHSNVGVVARARHVTRRRPARR